MTVPHFSAGGVVIHRLPHQITYLVLTEQRPTTRFVLPKGHIEAGETPLQAAQREIQEESGLANLTLLAPLDSTTHTYHLPDDTRLHHKKVDWFLFESNHAQVTYNQDESFVGYQWLPYPEAHRTLTHTEEANMLVKAFGLLQT